MSDSEWETVKDKLRELVDQARIITNVTGELESAMAQGEVVAVEAWNDSYNNLIWDEQFTDSVEYMQPKDQKIFSWVCGFALSSTAGKDAPMEKAYALIDSGLSIGASQFLIEDWGYAPANADGFSVASEEALELIIVDTSDVDAWLANTIFQEVMPNLDKIVEEWELIRAKVD
jgi:spermidine/putrescine-binding protein